MKLNKELKVKIYLKSRKRPFIFILDTDKQLNELKMQLETERIITFGPLTFFANDVKYIIAE